VLLYLHNQVLNLALPFPSRHWKELPHDKIQLLFHVIVTGEVLLGILTLPTLNPILGFEGASEELFGVIDTGILLQNYKVAMEVYAFCLFWFLQTIEFSEKSNTAEVSWFYK
jgi:hypothetical protein